jgi:hypothetical protein
MTTATAGALKKNTPIRLTLGSQSMTTTMSSDLSTGGVTRRGARLLAWRRLDRLLVDLRVNNVRAPAEAGAYLASVASHSLT